MSKLELYGMKGIVVIQSVALAFPRLTQEPKPDELKISAHMKSDADLAFVFTI